MKELIFGGPRFNSAVGDVGLLVLRLFTGLSLALAHGLGKVPPSPQFVAGIERLGFPGWAGWLSAFAEVVGGIALAAGLGTRLAALLIVTNLSVAALLQHANDPYLRKELPLLFLAVALMFVFVGGGRFSLDRLFRR